MRQNNITVKVLDINYFINTDMNGCLLTEKGKDYNVIVVPFRSMEVTPLETLITMSFSDAEKDLLAQYKKCELMSNEPLAPFVMYRNSDKQALMFIAEPLHTCLQDVQNELVITELYDDMYTAVGLMVNYWGFEEVILPVLGVLGTRGLPVKLMSEMAISNIEYFLSSGLLDSEVAKFHILTDSERAKEIMEQAINTHYENLEENWFAEMQMNDGVLDDSGGNIQFDVAFSDFLNRTAPASFEKLYANKVDSDFPLSTEDEKGCGCTEHECNSDACQCAKEQHASETKSEDLFDCQTCVKKGFIESIMAKKQSILEFRDTANHIETMFETIDLPAKCVDCSFHLAFTTRNIKENDVAKNNSMKHLSRAELESLKKRPCIKVHPSSEGNPEDTFTTVQACQTCTENCIFKGTWSTFEQFKG